MIDIIKNVNLEYTKGDTFSLPVRALPGNEFSEGMQLEFVIAESEQSDPVIEKVFNVNDDLTFTVTLTDSEKKKLSLGEYIYKMITYKNNEIITEISGYFTVVWGATKARKKALVLGNSVQFTVQEKNDVAFNTAARHTHENKTVLDTITKDMLDTYATKEEISKWTTVLDVTLTAEQAGSSEVLLAIENYDIFKNARMIRTHVRYPCSEAKSANSIWTTAILQNEAANAYAITLMSGYNIACTAGANMDMTSVSYIYNFIGNNAGYKTISSIMNKANPWWTAIGNSKTTAEALTGAYAANLISKESYSPYLKVTNGIAFEEGSKFFMEVYV